MGCGFCCSGFLVVCVWILMWFVFERVLRGWNGDGLSLVWKAVDRETVKGCGFECKKFLLMVVGPN